ncbi:fatty acyl-CoA reductase 2, chloroplastic-like [Nicotiana tabacum]|uniref:Fatty acyl-CoA reductase 2, chloroplastic-like n=1 Tax=Nicotiana tabacum TaxID=4097 RepID=A0AC58TF54_TOBAC
MAAIAKHGYLPNPELNVYHLASMPMNPLSYSQLFDYSYEFFHSFPFINTKGNKVEVKRMKYFDKISAFSNFICEELFRQYGLQDLTEEEIIKFKRIFKRKVEYLKQFSKLYEPYLFYKGWFHNGNMQKLMEEMSEEEKKSFEIDVGQINWGDYFLKIHIPGVQENVLKDNNFTAVGELTGMVTKGTDVHLFPLLLKHLQRTQVVAMMSTHGQFGCTTANLSLNESFEKMVG